MFYQEKEHLVLIDDNNAPEHVIVRAMVAQTPELKDSLLAWTAGINQASGRRRARLRYFVYRQHDVNLGQKT